LVVFDIWHDGGCCCARRPAARSHGPARGEAKERDLSWLDYSYPADLSADGKIVLFDEEGVGGGVQYGNSKELTYAVYIRNTDGSQPFDWVKESPTRFLPTRSGSSSKSRLAEQLRLLPTGAGETSRSPTIRSITSGRAGFRRQALCLLRQRARKRRAPLYAGPFRRNLEADFPEGVDATAFAVSPDGQLVVGTGPDEKGYFYPTAGGDPRVVNGLEAGDIPIIWNKDGRSIYLYRTGEVPAKFTSWN